MKANILKHIIFTAFFAFAGLLFASCDNDEPVPNPPLPPEPEVKIDRRTVLVYQAANNSLGTPSAAFDSRDVEEMIAAANAGDIGDDCRLLVYRGAYRAEPLLMEISREKTDTLRTYSSDTLSVDSRRMAQVLYDMTFYAPAKEYGLVLWSHGSGWVQDGMADQYDSDIRRSFGVDNSRTMNITTLAKVLEDGPELKWLYFDCCYMASVETLYQLRHTAPLIVASATELPVDGMPYDLNVREFFRQGDSDMIQAATNTFDSYDILTGSSRTCTMSVTDTRALDALAEATAAIYAATPQSLPDGYTAQRFETSNQNSCRYFDFAHYVRALCFNADGTERYAGATRHWTDFESVLNDCILYRAATPKLWNSLAINEHCGLSTYILRSPDKVQYRNYDTLSWYADVASKLNIK